MQSAGRIYLEHALQRDYSRTRVDPVGKIEPLMAPPGEVSFSPGACGRDSLAPRMCVKVDVLVDRPPYKSLAVWYKVQAYRNVLAAKIAVAAGAPFSAESFSIESRDVAASSAPVPVDGAPRGARLKHAVQAGQILLQNDLEPIPAVTRNQEVSVRIQAG